MPRNVAVVLEPDFSDRLEKLSFRTPVWLVDTPANRVAAEEAWRVAVEWPHVAVTLFRPPAGDPSRDDWRALLEQIAAREGNVESLEVIGSPLTLAARATLVAGGFTRFDENAEGFRARRF